MPVSRAKQGIAVHKNAGKGFPPKLARPRLNHTTSGRSRRIARSTRQGLRKLLNFQQRTTLKPSSSDRVGEYSSPRMVSSIPGIFLSSSATWKPYSFNASRLGGNEVTRQIFIIIIPVLVRKAHSETVCQEG